MVSRDILLFLDVLWLFLDFQVSGAVTGIAVVKVTIFQSH
jgi:hypothetical protein